MSAFPAPRVPSAAWGRLKASPTDPLEVYGLPSKGETRLLDYKIQEIYYNKIVERYMQFCAAAGRRDNALDKAFASLSLDSAGQKASSNTAPLIENVSLSPESRAPSELAILMMSMRKLREAIVASSRIDMFSQRAYVFIIRAAILTSTYESYQPALLHLLYKIHQRTPLPTPELHEFVSYHILDLACRLADYEETHRVRKRWNHADKRVDDIIKALVHENWVEFWRVRGVVDGYQRKLLGWAEDGIRLHALKCLGRSYMTVDKSYVEHCTGRTWEELKLKNKVGWELDGDRVTIRRMKIK